MPTVDHINAVYANNRAEVSHQPNPAMCVSYGRRFFIDSGSTASDAARPHQKPVSPWPPPHAGGQLSDFGVPGRLRFGRKQYALKRLRPRSANPFYCGLQLVQMTIPNTDAFLFRKTFNGKKGTIRLVQVKLVFRLTWEGHEGHI